MNNNLLELKRDIDRLQARITLADCMLERVSNFDYDVFEWKKDEETGEPLVTKTKRPIFDYDKVTMWFMNNFSKGLTEKQVANMANELRYVVESAVLAWARGQNYSQ